MNLGIALDAKGDHTQATAQYRKAVALMPRSADAHCNLGGALSTEGRYEEAIIEFREGLKFKPNFAECEQSLAETERLKKSSTNPP